MTALWVENLMLLNSLTCHLGSHSQLISQPLSFASFLAQMAKMVHARADRLKSANGEAAGSLLGAGWTAQKYVM